MKILHINTYDRGGAGIAAIRLHQALLAKGIDSSMIFLDKSNINVPSTFSYIDYNNNKKEFILRNLIRIKNKLLFRFSHRYDNMVKLKNKVAGYEMFSFNQSDFDITTQKIVQDADIIHLHWIAGFVDYKSFKKINKPIIWTLHDMNPFTGGCHYSSGCEKYKNECRNCPQLAGTINTDNSFTDQKYKQSFLAKNSPIITTPSAWLTNCASMSSLFKNFQTLQIPYSLDLSIFKRQDKGYCRLALNLPDDKKILLFVSDSIENRRKGFDLLLNALEQLDRSDLHICAIGLKNENENYHEKITLLGSIADERLMALAYSAADVFVLPSREDNLPNVMLESLACGTPVIAFPVGGMLDVIKTGSNGILAKDLSSESLAEALTDFLDGKYIFDSEEISQDAKQKFAPTLQAERYMKLYQTML